MSDMQIPVINRNLNTPITESFISGEDLKIASCRMEIERHKERLWLAHAIEDVFNPLISERELEALISK